MPQTAAPASPLAVQRSPDGKIYSPIRKKYLFETPEERVRQEYVCVLVNEYGYSLEQMEEEIDPTGRERRGGPRSLTQNDSG